MIEVETRASHDGSRQAVDMTAWFAWGHRNQRSLGPDLRHLEAKEILLKLVAQGDVALSNFGPVTLNSLPYEVCWRSHVERRDQTRGFTCVMQKV